jgi:uncharacterized membrane protein YeaQ/YmgE (transglycosylase-associated protein family)
VHTSGMVAAIIGAVIVLLTYRAITRRRHPSLRR